MKAGFVLLSVAVLVVFCQAKSVKKDSEEDDFVVYRVPVKALDLQTQATAQYEGYDLKPAIGRSSSKSTSHSKSTSSSTGSGRGKYYAQGGYQGQGYGGDQGYDGSSAGGGYGGSSGSGYEGSGSGYEANGGGYGGSEGGYGGSGSAQYRVADLNPVFRSGAQAGFNVNEFTRTLNHGMTGAFNSPSYRNNRFIPQASFAIPKAYAFKNFEFPRF